MPNGKTPNTPNKILMWSCIQKYKFTLFCRKTNFVEELAHFLAYSCHASKLCWRTKDDKYQVCEHIANAVDVLHDTKKYFDNVWRQPKNACVRNSGSRTRIIDMSIIHTCIRVLGGGWEGRIEGCKVYNRWRLSKRYRWLKVEVAPSIRSRRWKRRENGRWSGV